MIVDCIQEYHAPGISADTVSAWSSVADLLEGGAAQVDQVSLPHTRHSIVCYAILCVCEVASNMARYDGIQYGEIKEVMMRQIIILWYSE